MFFVIRVIGVVISLTALPFMTVAQPRQPNVLFIAIDDLRVNYGAYDIDDSLTPNIDALASQGVAFTRAYSNVPVCGASRASMMTGVWPTKDRFVAFNNADKDAPWAPSMAGVFKQNGYTTISLGKVFNNLGDHAQDWSESPWRPAEVKDEELMSSNGKQEVLLSRHDYVTAEGLRIARKGPKNHPAFEQAEGDDDIYKNGKIALKAVAELKRLAMADKPFFLAVGLLKPHLPFNAPKRYWDLYNRDDIELSKTPLMVTDAPPQAYHNFGELRNYGHDGVMPKQGAIPDDLARELIHGYYAATSYSDALVGQILATLEALSLAQNTIVVVWGDHGWSLGEHGLWAKHSSYNVANQIPLIFRVPKQVNSDVMAGVEHPGLVESVDIFPTLMNLTGLTVPDSVNGDSLLPALKDPELIVNDAIFPRWKNADSIRTDQFFYTEWRNKAGDSIVARMLFDHHQDPHETKNLATDAAYQEVVTQLSQRLQEHIARSQQVPAN